MTRKKKVQGFNPDLEKAISSLLKDVMDDKESSLTDKARIIDRALKLEAIRLKAQDDQWGSGFLDDEDPE